MKRRMPIFFVFLIVIIFLGGIIYLTSKSVISDGVEKIELKQAQSDMNKLHSLLNAATIRLEQHVYNWSHWDEAYHYLIYQNSDFIYNNLDKNRLNKLHLTGLAFYSLIGERLNFIDSSHLEFGEEWVECEVKTLQKVIDFLIQHHLEQTSGFINVNGVGLILAAHKVYASNPNKPSQGYLIMTTALDQRFINSTQKISGLNFSVLPLVAFNLIYAPKTDEDNFKLLQTTDEIRVYSIIKNIFSEPAFCIQLKRNRDIAKFGEQISQKNFWLMCCLGFLVFCSGIVTIYFSKVRFIKEEMEYRSNHDSLTGLPNSKLFTANLQKLLRNPTHPHIGLLYIDLDHFKSVNDSYGYRMGDRVLCETAQRLASLFPNGYVGRPSVDNFLVLLLGTREEQILSQVKNVSSALDSPFQIDGNTLHLGASIGLSLIKKHDNDALTCIHRSELAMNAAKDQGGNQLAIYDKTMDDAAFNKKRIEDALYDAVANKTFSVAYQPKVDIYKQDVAGLEALVRWKMNNGKVIPPPVFIPIAEEAGLITEIDMFVLRSACRQVLTWQKDGIGAVPVAVNMSVRSILSNGFADQVINILKEEGTPPALIDIEITESSFMSDMDKAYAAISRLHASGIRIALDDFGTGYSCLQYLSAMPISFLKIDKKFVDDIFSGKETAQPLVKSILSLASNLGMLTISEGVEQKNQLKFLKENGASIIQGYIFSKPLDPQACSEYLKNRKSMISSVMVA